MRDAALRRLLRLGFVLSGKALAQGSLLVFGIVVARVAGAEEFALFATALTWVLLLDACLGAPIDYTVVRFAALHAGEPARSARVQAAAVRTKLVVGGALLAAAAVFGHPIAAAVLHDGGRAGLVWVAAGSTASLLLMRSVATSLQVQSRFATYATVDASQGAARAAVVVVLAACGAGRAEYYLAGFCGVSASMLLPSLWLVPRDVLRARWIARGEARAVARFLGVTTAIIMVGTLTGRTDLLVLAARAAPDTVARYAAAAQLASMATLLAGYASVIVQPGLIPAARRGEMPRLLQEGLALALAPACVLTLVVSRWGSAIMGGVFGAGFADADGLLRVLTLGTCIDMLCMPIAMTFALQMRPRSALYGELAIAAAYLAAAAPAAAGGAEAMAWLATAVRAAKGVLYLGITLRAASERSRMASAGGTEAFRR